MDLFLAELGRIKQEVRDLQTALTLHSAAIAQHEVQLTVLIDILVECEIATKSELEELFKKVFSNLTETFKKQMNEAKKQDFENRLDQLMFSNKEGVA